jgi:hypothetical protein
MLTGLTTLLFYHGPDNPVLQPASTQIPQGKNNTNNNWSTPLRKIEGNNPRTVKVQNSTLQGKIRWVHKTHRRHESVHKFYTGFRGV